MQAEEIKVPKGALKYVTNEYIVYKKEYLYKNLEHEIELMKAGKKYHESGKAEEARLNLEAFKKQLNGI